MLKILVVDDEAPAREELRYLLLSILKTALVFEASGAEEAMEWIEKENIDVAFIDINMPEMDGISLSKEIHEINREVKIVFATAYDIYAVKAFELNAVDYILKPFEEDRLKMTIRKLLKERYEEYKVTNRDGKSLIGEADKKLKKLSVWKGDRIVLIDIKDIVYIETEERNTKIKTLNGEFTAGNGISCMEEKLDKDNFFRVHRSFLINLEHVKEIQPWFNNSYIVRMKGYEKIEIPVSRKQIKSLKELLGF